MIVAMAFTWPLIAIGQRTAGPRIGLLNNGAPGPNNTQEKAFQDGLRHLGWIEGQNITIEKRWAFGDPSKLPALVQELVRSGVEVIVVGGTPAMKAAQNGTHTIPVVFVTLIDPVDGGFVASLARPGGNMTGVASQFEELITKQIQLTKEALPNLRYIGLIHLSTMAPTLLRAAQEAALSLGISTENISVSTERLSVSKAKELERAFTTAHAAHVDAIIVFPSPYFDTERTQVIDLAARNKLPAIYEFRNYVDDGGLMSYGPSINDMYERSATYVDHILKGSKPSDLPVERASKFELVINLKTAAALGVAIPPSLLQRADELVQ